MTGVAVRRHCLKLTCRASLVAGVTIHGGVRTGEREAIVVLLNLLNGNLPSPHRVALFTVRTQLTFVDVGMAILAALSDIGENGPDVTFRARNRGVHATEWILRLVVIEFRDGSDRLPSVCCVAVLAGYIQISVGTMRASRDLCPSCTETSGKRKNQH